MDLSQPFSAVAPTLDGPVLRVLARTTRPMSGRQIHRIGGVGSEAGVRKVLNRLVDQGVVDATQAGRAMLYVGNREHLAWPAIEQIANLTATMNENIRAEVARWAVPAASVVLFGSAARGDGDPESDVDLLVVRPGVDDHPASGWAEQVDALRRRIERSTGDVCQIYELNEAELADHVETRAPIVQSWLRDGVTLGGDDIGALIRRVSRSEP